MRAWVQVSLPMLIIAPGQVTSPLWTQVTHFQGKAYSSHGINGKLKLTVCVKMLSEP